MKDKRDPKEWITDDSESIEEWEKRMNAENLEFSNKEAKAS